MERSSRRRDPYYVEEEAWEDEYTEEEESEEEERVWWTRLKDCVRALTAFLFSHVGVCVLVVGYTIAGAFMFQAIEDEASRKAAEEAMQAKERVRHHREQAVESLWQITLQLNVFHQQNWTRVTEEEVTAYGQTVVREAQEHAIDGVNDSRTWSISAAFLYSLTVITTIGYGNISPRTAWGKVVTILYGIAGMPLFLLYMSNVGDVLATSFKWMYARCCQCRWRRRRLQRPPPANATGSPSELDAKEVGKNHQTGEAWELEAWDMYGYEIGQEGGVGGEEAGGEEEDDDPQNVTVPISLCLGVMASYVYGGAEMFKLWETWDVLDGSYFCFISLSTIGFGDLVPGSNVYSEDSIELSFVFCSMYLMLGMALIAMCFNLMQEQVVSKVRACGRRCGCGGQAEEES